VTALALIAFCDTFEANISTLHMYMGGPFTAQITRYFPYVNTIQISFKSLIATEFSYLFIYAFAQQPKGQFKHELREKQNKHMHTKNTNKESCII
jgi:hypothetical protein